jgi:hypothetical protein
MVGLSVALVVPLLALSNMSAGDRGDFVIRCWSSASACCLRC